MYHNLILIGTGEDWLEELRLAIDTMRPSTALGVLNRAGTVCPLPFSYWFTMDPEVMTKELWEIGVPRTYDKVVISEDRARQFLSGSIAMYATLWALDHGFKHVHLVGCPLNGPYTCFRGGWEMHSQLFRGKVSAQNGWLKHFLHSLNYTFNEWQVEETMLRG